MVSHVQRSGAVPRLASGPEAQVVPCGWGCGRGSSTAAGSVSGPLSEAVACLHYDLWPEILKSPATVANPDPLAYPATTQHVLPQCKHVFQSAIVAYDWGAFFGITGFHWELTALHCSRTVSASCPAIWQDCLQDHGLYSNWLYNCALIWLPMEKVMREWTQVSGLRLLSSSQIWLRI